MVLKDYLKKSIERLSLLENIIESKEISIVCDSLKNQKKVTHETLYYKTKNSSEEELLFIFGFDFFIKELEEQEFKKNMNQNYLDFIIYRAYKKIKDSKKKNEKITIGDILNQIQNKEKDSLELHKIIEKILTQSYYLGWDLEKNSSGIESDYFIEIPDNFLVKVKQRFNLDIIEQIYENNSLFIFLNGKGKLIIVLKNYDQFTNKEITSFVGDTIKEIFKLKKINF